MRYIGRCLSLLLALMLLCPAVLAVAEAPFLVHTQSWTLEEVPLQVRLSADVRSLMPYDEERVAMLKAVTDKLSLRLRTGEDEGSVTILVGQTNALTLAYLDDAVQLSCIPETSFTSQEGAMDKLLGESTAVGMPYGLRADAESLLDDGWVLLESTREALSAYGKPKNVKTNITDMGLARTCTDYTIPKDDAEAFGAMLLEHCPEGWLREILAGLTFSGKQTLRIYRDEGGSPLRMEYNGTCGPEGNLRTVKLVWRTRRDDTAHRDEVTLTSPAKSGGNKNTLEFERIISRNKKGAIVMEGSFTYTVTKDKQTTTRKGEFNLTNANTDESDVITGEVTLQQKLPGEDSFAGLRFEPDLTLSGDQENPVVTGQIGLKTLNGKNVLDDVIVSIDLRRSETSDWQAREETIDMDQLTADELAALQNDAALGIANAIVRPLIMLLGDSADWFFRDMLPEQIQRITDAANTVIYQ